MKLKILKIFFITLLVIVFLLFVLSLRPIPKHITYGVSFSELHANELGLDWRATYRAILDDLGAKNLRLSAHWPEIEPKLGQFNFSDFDYQINEAQKRGVKTIVSVGRRLPGWPECHNPDWLSSLSNEQKEVELMKYIEAVVNRYKGYSSVEYWQVENEVFLTTYAKGSCGNFIENSKLESFLQKEIALVKKLDPTRKIVLTDSGELGLWYKAYRNADVFGTSVYLYVWNHYVGAIRYPMTPGFFRIKTNLMNLLYGSKDTFLSELSGEPWLLKPIKETPIDDQLESMSLYRFKEIINFGKKTGFEKQLLWGAEWWYYMDKNGYPEFWERAQELFKE
jgi:hypothetical protein